MKNILVWCLLSAITLFAPINTVLASPTPEPPTQQTGWEYDLNYFTVKGGRDYTRTKLHFYYSPVAENFVVFHHSFMVNFNLAENKFWSDPTIGSDASWNFWKMGYTKENIWLMTNNATDPNLVLNVCVKKSEEFANRLNKGKFFYYNVTEPGLSGGATITNEYKCFNKISTDGKSVVERNGEDQGITLTPINTSETNYKYQTSFTMIQQGAWSNARTIAPASRKSSTPIAANIEACKKSTSQRIITDEKGAEEWINTVKTNLKAADQSGGRAYEFFMKYFDNASEMSKLKTALINYDSNSFKTYYGPVPPSYPSVALTDMQENALTAKLQEVESKKPLEWDAAGAAKVSNALGTVAAVAITLASLGAAAGIGAAAGGAAATGGAVATATTAVPGAAAATASGLLIPSTVAPATLTALTAASGPVAASAGTAVAAGVSRWAIGALIGKVLAVGATAWATANTGNIVVDIMNNAERNALRDDWIRNLAEYHLDLFYAGLNNSFNQCLKDKGDPYAIVNQAIKSKLDNIAKVYSGVNSFDPGKVETDKNGCPKWNLVASVTGTSSYNPFDIALCWTLRFLYDIAVWLQQTAWGLLKGQLFG